MKGLALILVVLLFSCRHTEPNRGKILAKVGGAELYDSDLNISLGSNADSLAIKRKLVNDWVKDQLIYKKAISLLSESEKNKERELKNYYESLVNHTWLEKMVAMKMDTVVQDKDIEGYYKDNQKNFELKRNIIRFLYVKVPIDMPVNNSVKIWMQNPVKRNLDSLKVYAKRFARNALLDTAKWYYFSDICREIPILQDYNPEHFIKNDDYIELKDGQYRYQMNIVDGRISEDISPIVLVKDKIRNIILNHRKTEQIRSLENQVLKEGAAQKQYETY